MFLSILAREYGTFWKGGRIWIFGSFTEGKWKLLSCVQLFVTPWTILYFIFLGSNITAGSARNHEIKRHLLLGKKAMTKLDSILKSRDITLARKVCIVKAIVFPVVVYDVRVGPERNWAQKNWCFWNVVLEKTLKSPLDCKEIQPVNPKGNQSWIFIGRTDAEAEASILWPPDTKNWLIGKDPDAGKEWRQEEKGMTEDEIVRWHQWLNGHESEQALGIGDVQGSLQSMALQRIRHDSETELMKEIKDEIKNRSRYIFCSWTWRITIVKIYTT